MTRERAEQLQEAIIDLFVDIYGYDVSVGLRRAGDDWGVKVTSREPGLIMATAGPVVTRGSQTPAFDSRGML